MPDQDALAATGTRTRRRVSAGIEHQPRPRARTRAGAPSGIVPGRPNTQPSASQPLQCPSGASALRGQDEAGGSRDAREQRCWEDDVRQVCPRLDAAPRMDAAGARKRTASPTAFLQGFDSAYRRVGDTWVRYMGDGREMGGQRAARCGGLPQPASGPVGGGKAPGVGVLPRSREPNGRCVVTRTPPLPLVCGLAGCGGGGDVAASEEPPQLISGSAGCGVDGSSVLPRRSRGLNGRACPGRPAAVGAAVAPPGVLGRRRRRSARSNDVGNADDLNDRGDDDVDDLHDGATTTTAVPHWGAGSVGARRARVRA